jgi:hypothetical protein
MSLIAVILCQLLLLIYHQFTTRVDLYPFNNIRNYTRQERRLESTVNGLIMLIPVVSFAMHWRWMMYASTVLYGLLIIAEYRQWWRHYFFRPNPEWLDIYNRIFRQTIIVLPLIRNNPVPNLEHTLLHGWTVVCFLVSLWYVLTGVGAGQ